MSLHLIGAYAAWTSKQNHLKSPLADWGPSTDANTLGLPVAITLSAGQVSDVKGYAPVMDQPGPQPRVLLADKGYHADFILADLEARGVAAVIPAKRNRKVQPLIDGHIYVSAVSTIETDLGFQLAEGFGLIAVT
jgi:hypothetical protein